MPDRKDLRSLRHEGQPGRRLQQLGCPLRGARSLSLAACSACRASPLPGGDASPPVAAEAAALRDVLRVPRAVGPMKLDGELDEPDWSRAARTGPFTDARGGEARPFSEARFLWADGRLLLGLYAADDDLRATITAHDGPVWLDDAFSLVLTPAIAGPSSFLIDVSASGVVTDARRAPSGKPDPSWESGLAVAVDRDGTLNDPRDEDEEWVVEGAIPLASLGLAGAGARFAVEIARCDTPRGEKQRRRGGFGGRARGVQVLELAP